jgi:hypothetical protein
MANFFHPLKLCLSFHGLLIFCANQAFYNKYLFPLSDALVEMPHVVIDTKHICFVFFILKQLHALKCSDQNNSMWA